MERICIPVEEFAQRVKNAQRLMVERGIDVMFAFANEAEPQFVRYLSDYWPSFETAGVMFGQTGDPVLLIGPESMTYASDRSKIRDIRKIKCLRESSNPEYPGHKLDTFEEVLEQVRRQVDAGMRAADACKTAAKASGFSKNELYRALLEG